MNVRFRSNRGPRMGRLAVFLLFLCAAAFAATPLYAQGVLVSRNVKGTNVNPRVAVASTTGNVLVTWNRISDDGDTSQVWAALMKRKKDGTFGKPRKARMVSAAQGYHSNPRAIWLAERKSYLVVWDTWQVPGTASDILARTLNKSGKPTGKVLTIVSDGDENFAPTPTSADVAYTRIANGTRSASSSEIRAVDLDEDLNPTDTVRVLSLSSVPYQHFGELYEELGLGCRVSVVEHGRFTEDPKVVVTLYNDGEQVAEVELLRQVYLTSVVDGAFSGGQLTLLTRRLGTATSDANYVHVQLVVCSGLELKVDKTADGTTYLARLKALILSSPFTVGSRTRSVANSAHLITIAEEQLRAQPINEDGEIAGDAQVLADRLGDATALNGSGLPEAKRPATTAPDMAVVWLVPTTGTNNEIRALAARREQ